MKQLPLNAIAYKKTPQFNQSTIPPALLQQHSTKVGSWGKIRVLSGQLRYQILTAPSEEQLLTPDLPGIIPPQVPHHVEPVGDVEFFIEFYQIPSTETTTL